MVEFVDGFTSARTGTMLTEEEDAVVTDAAFIPVGISSSQASPSCATTTVAAMAKIAAKPKDDFMVKDLR